MKMSKCANDPNEPERRRLVLERELEEAGIERPAKEKREHS